MIEYDEVEVKYNGILTFGIIGRLVEEKKGKGWVIDVQQWIKEGYYEKIEPYKADCERMFKVPVKKEKD